MLCLSTVPPHWVRCMIAWIGFLVLLMSPGNLSLRYKLLLPSAVGVVLLFVLALTVGIYLRSIADQNEAVRQWMHALERMHIALSAGQRLQQLATEAELDSRNKEDIQFEYFEQFGIFEQHLTHPYLVARMPSAMQQSVLPSIVRLRDIERTDPARVRAEWQALLPKLEVLYQHFWIQRRASYVQFYDAVTRQISSLMTIVLTTTLAGFILMWLLTRWLANNIARRIADSRNVCSEVIGSEIAPTAGDELDALAACVTRMREGLTHQVNAGAVLEGSEDERRRIAMDLHDQALSDLNHLARDMKMLSSGGSVEPQQLVSASQNLDEIIEDIRRIMDDLHPQTLDALGLEAALQSYLKRKLERSDGPALQCHFERDLDRRLSAFQRLTLYRISLEALNNMMRHAHCTRCEIDCRVTDNRLILSVEDNGSGFDFATRRNQGRGLANIARRAQAIGAEVSWRAARFSSGTRFEVRLALDAVDSLPNSNAA